MKNTNLLIHEFYKPVLSTYNVPGTVTDARDEVIIKTEFHGAYILARRDNENNVSQWKHIMSVRDTKNDKARCRKKWQRILFYRGGQEKNFW